MQFTFKRLINEGSIFSISSNYLVHEASRIGFCVSFTIIKKNQKKKKPVSFKSVFMSCFSVS